MKYEIDELLRVVSKVHKREKLSVGEIKYLLSFKHLEKEPLIVKILKNSALPLSLFLGFLFSVYPEIFQEMVKTSPRWMNLTPRMLAGIDYLWDILGDPVGKANIIYHLPNIALYSFGVLGIKKLFEALDRKSWLDRVIDAQKKLKERIESGSVNLNLSSGHSILFVGKGDFIGMQFVMDHKKSDVVTVSESKPAYTNIWNKYKIGSGYYSLKKILKRVGDKDTGEYIFFPVKDDQIFLPSEKAYDLAPHNLDILCQDLRNIEKELEWNIKRIIIIGDKYHQSFVQSEDKFGIIEGASDTISLEKISKRYSNVTLIDPTDLVLQKILQIAGGRKIIFRATLDGLKEYKKRFFKRIEELGYSEVNNKAGTLTIGYDLFEDQTEQQTLSRAVDDYFPVVLSKSVYDALIRNGYQANEFLYVPEIVLNYLKSEASEQ